MKKINPNTEDCKAKGAFQRALADCHMKLIADPMIPLGALKVAITICHHCNQQQFVAGNGLVVFPGITTLAALTGLHRTTVMSAVRWLEARGHYKVIRRRVGNKNLANRYLPLRKTVAQLNEVVSRRKGALPPSSVAALPPSRVATRPELLTELLTEPLTQYKDTASVDTDGAKDEARQGSKEGDSRGRGGFFTVGSPSQAEPVDSLKAECYRLAREYQPSGGAALVTVALTNMTVEDCLEEIHYAISEGIDLGSVLWRP